MKLLRNTLRFLGRRYLLLVSALLLLALPSLLPPILFRHFASEIFSPSFNAHAFALSFLGYGLAVAAMLFLARAGAALCQESLRLLLETTLRERILRSLHSTPLVQFEQSKRGEWYTRITGDLSRVEAFLTESLPAQIRLATIAIGSAALFFYYGGAVALIPILAALFIGSLNLAIQRRIAPNLKQLRDQHAGVFQELVDNFEGLRTIRSCRSEAFIQSRFSKKLFDLRKRSLSVVRVIGTLLGTNEALSQLMVTACLSVTALAVGGSQMTASDALIFPFFIGMFYGSLQDLSKNLYDWNRFRIEGGRLVEFLEIGERTPVREIPVVKEIPTEIVLTAVRMGFQDNEIEVPQYFCLRRGQLQLIKGPSGCGKSTFLEVVAGLRPAFAGTFRAGNHVGALATDGADLRAFCAYVEQRPYLFDGTLRENVTLGLEASDEKVWKVLNRTGLESMVRQRGGLEFRLDDRGENVSEGQRYRIALARALLLERPFLLLDEPFAALDEASSTQILRAVSEERLRAGIVIVTHQVPDSLSEQPSEEVLFPTGAPAQLPPLAVIH